MKILHIAPIGHHPEGIGSVISKLYPEQIKLNNDVRIITVNSNNIYEGWPIYRINRSEDFISFISSWIPDIVIFHSHFHPEFVKFAKILKNQKIPFCVQLHGALSKMNYQKSHLKKMLAGFMYFNWILRNASSIIYLNQAEYGNSIVPKYNPNYAIIPNGCESQGVVDLSRSVNNPIRIVFIGRISYNHKGLDILMASLRKLNDDYKSVFHLFFYGNEDDVDVLKLKSDLSGLAIASYEGSVYGEKKNIVLDNADIFILSSRYEGMPMGVLEAWSHGVPCILTPGTNMTIDYHNSDAFWKAELSADSLSSTIVDAINDYRLSPSRFRRSAYDESLRYHWDKIAKMTIELYTQMTI